MKKILSFALCFALLVSVLLVLPAHVGAASSGAFGNGLYWNFDKDSGNLEFSGSGNIKNGDSIAWYMSINASKVKKITFAQGVNGVDCGAIADYPNLTEIAISDTVVSIAEGAFSCLPSLDVISVDENNPAYYSEGNCLIERASGKVILGANSSVLPEGAVSLADGALNGYPGLESLDIPATLTEIGADAVRNCTGLCSITVSPGNPAYRADGNCLIEKDTGRLILGCNGSVIPDDGSVTEIADMAFMGCAGLETVYIPNSVEYIGVGAFAECFSLREVRLPADLEEIPDGMFSNCSSLESIDLPEGLKSIGGGAFFCCASLEEIYVPDGVETIGPGAFCGCENVTSVRLPEGITEIGPSTFESCFSIEELVLPESLEYIGECAFVDCSALTSLDIPDGVTEIGDSAFAYCTSITDLELPDSLETIGYAAFANCESLENITLPESLMTIESDAFIDSSIIFTEYEGALYLGTDDNPYYALVETAEDIVGEVHINPDTKIICDAAFEGQDEITEVVIPDGVKSIGAGAFERCPAVETVKIPTGLKFLGSGAFNGCFGIKNITMPIRILAQQPDAFGSALSVEELFLSGTRAEMVEYGDQIDLSAFPDAEIHQPQTPHVLPGDVDGDGSVSMKDCSILKKYLAGSGSIEKELLANADVNCDGDVNLEDIKAIKKIIAGSY